MALAPSSNGEELLFECTLQFFNSLPDAFLVYSCLPVCVLPSTLLVNCHSSDSIDLHVVCIVRLKRHCPRTTLNILLVLVEVSYCVVVMSDMNG